MFTLTSTVHVDGIRGADIFEFLLKPTDEQYQRWWPGVHLQFHNLKEQNGKVGNLVYMDELIGRRRVRLTGRVIEAVPGARIAWQLQAWVRLPARLSVDLRDDPSGVTITHAVQVGWPGAGAVLDPLLRLYFSPAFARDLDAHVRTEFPKMRETLSTRFDAVRTLP